MGAFTPPLPSQPEPRVGGGAFPHQRSGRSPQHAGTVDRPSPNPTHPNESSHNVGEPSDRQGKCGQGCPRNQGGTHSRRTAAVRPPAPRSRRCGGGGGGGGLPAPGIRQVSRHVTTPPPLILLPARMPADQDAINSGGIPVARKPAPPSRVGRGVGGEAGSPVGVPCVDGWIEILRPSGQGCPRTRMQPTPPESRPRESLLPLPARESRGWGG